MKYLLSTNSDLTFCLIFCIFDLLLSGTLIYYYHKFEMILWIQFCVFCDMELLKANILPDVFHVWEGSFGAYEAKVHLFMAIWFHIFPPFNSPVHMINNRSCFLLFFIFFLT